MEERKTWLIDVLQLDMGTLSRLLDTLDHCINDSDITRPMLSSQINGAQYVLKGVYKKLGAIHDKYKFEVDWKLFEHQVHEFDWEIILPKTKETTEPDQEETPTDSESQ